MRGQGLQLVFDDFDVQYKVTQYDFVVVHEGCRSTPIRMHDAKLTEEIRDALNRLEIGEVIEFENIKAEKRNEVSSEEFDVVDLRLGIT